jgi:hypothetical protein
LGCWVFLRWALDTDPNFVNAHGILYELYMRKGLHEQAVDDFEKWVPLIDIEPEPLAELRQIWRRRLGCGNPTRRSFPRFAGSAQHGSWPSPLSGQTAFLDCGWNSIRYRIPVRVRWRFGRGTCGIRPTGPRSRQLRARGVFIHRFRSMRLRGRISTSQTA